MAPRSHFPDTAAALTRRQWLQGTLALAAAGLAGSQVLRAVAQAPTESLDAFMALSQALTARPALDRAVGTRLLAALGKSSADFAAQLRPLAQALAAGSLSEAQQKTALQILEAWYLGVVDGNVVTYEQALMYSVVSDTLVIRTYCPNQPGFWAEPPVERQA
ncbi:Fructose dehydrogenase small subunit [Ralstonia wenshanensis]|uniref:sugar dehydrogenase complex small subunit n=1 Tax=Ralstonia wenshanensis TaxID=2842456 RepID=UPI0028F65FE0|nr:sugar dehydrogenase complex small subunit [Ralstonia wenshanensis]CAJ0809530.1 Fructose dehydrogenase small subunit [Ralstonia wenshanensis]